MMFFAAGFETTSNTISYTLHELCLNKCIQNKLRKEIVDNIEEYGGITYEGVQEMKYLKMCINETLRKYPVLPFLERICTKDYKVPGTDLVIDKGIPVYIPYPALHLDERYFPEPQKYIPERFLNKNFNMSGLFYMPFGEGPRNCLGERFGILSTQLALINIISRFEIEKCAVTPDPVEFSVKSFSNQSIVGLPMIVKPYEGY
nr:cytochrome P450 6k1-like [Leptinotarsa decemlineata]